MKQDVYRTAAGFPFHAMPATGATAPAILDAGWYYDGGSVRVVFADENGSATTCCFDHRQGTATPGRLYLGSSPVAPGARPALVDEERAIVSALLAAVRAAYPEDLRRKLLRLRYDTQVSSSEYHAWLVLRELRRRGAV
jgi:hypothetical protein